MLKMIIVDDEKIIRETIHSLIDWNSLGIDVAAVCKDGIEAFDCILDEYPDIVMTDIKMPGLSGLDLIEKVRAAQLNTEFIILSGYGEFEFARTAMRYGVKHYLLKPSNETEITQVIVSCVETCKSKTASRVDSLLTQLFLTEMPPEKLLQRRFFTELSGEQDVDLVKACILGNFQLVLGIGCRNAGLLHQRFDIMRRGDSHTLCTVGIGNFNHMQLAAGEGHTARQHPQAYQQSSPPRQPKRGTAPDMLFCFC